MERTYRYPAKSRWSYLAAALATGAMAAGAIALQFAGHADAVERGQLLVFTAVFAALAEHAAAAARIMAGEVRLALGGVGSGRSELVSWSDVVRVEIHPLRQRMDVFTSAGRRLLSVRSELEAFAAVQTYIIDHMQPRGCTPPCTIPLLSPFTGAPIAILSALLAVWFGPRRGLLLPALLGAISLLFGALYLARRRSIHVGAGQLVLRQGWRGFTVPYRDISAVHVQARPRTGGGAVHFVVLEREGSESIPIAGFRRGYREAFHCIEAAWRAAGGQHTGTSGPGGMPSAAARG